MILILRLLALTTLFNDRCFSALVLCLLAPGAVRSARTRVSGSCSLYAQIPARGLAHGKEILVGCYNIRSSVLYTQDTVKIRHVPTSQSLKRQVRGWVLHSETIH